MKKILFILLFSIYSYMLAAGLNSYTNIRFNFSAKYPNIFTDKLKSDNGDGITLTNKRKALKVLFYGRFNNANNSIKAEYKNNINNINKNNKKEITYSTQKKNWYILSGYDHTQNKIFYTKTFLVNDKFITYYIEYPSKDKQSYDNLITTINRNFK